MDTYDIFQIAVGVFLVILISLFIITALTENGHNNFCKYNGFDYKISESGIKYCVKINNNKAVKVEIYCTPVIDTKCYFVGEN